MAEGDQTLPEIINPNNFPAKLWRMVNNPSNSAICWDTSGEVIIIDQRLFEQFVLSVGNHCMDNLDTFKTTHFSSFVRQLNLYGFRKAESASSTNHFECSLECKSTLHLFCNPNFRRNHPELLVNLKRLTVDNKAKLEAGINVRCRPPSKYQRVSFGNDDDLHKLLMKGSPSWRSSARQESPHPYFTNKQKPVMPHNGTPVPPRYLPRGHGVPSSSFVFPSDKGVPVSLAHPYSSVVSGPFQQGLRSGVNYGNPNFTGLHPRNEQYHPGFYSSVCQCYRPPLMPIPGPFSPLSYYQAPYPVNSMSSPNQNLDLQNKSKQEIKKSDINLDTIFQIADEVMQTAPNNNLTKIVTPEKQSCREMLPVSAQEDIFRNTPKKNTLCTEPLTVITSGNGSVVKHSKAEQSVPSEKMPEDAISEVTRDDLNNNELILVEVSDTNGNTTQV